jgi:hypothetical protein
MRKISWRAIAIASALLALPALASAQPARTPIGKKGEIELNQPTRFGATLLDPGQYEVQHAVVSGRHYVVVRQQVRRNTESVTGPEMARVPCRVVTLSKPARFSFAYRALGDDGNAVLTEIRIEGEPAGHIIALKPAGAR